MKVGLVGASYTMRSLPFDAQRTVNLYPVLDQTGKEVSALYGTAGLEFEVQGGAGPGRKCFASANGRSFVISGSGVYEYSQDGTLTLRGSLEQSSGNVSVAENHLQLGICDGTSVYIFTYSDNTFVKVSSAGLPSVVGMISSIDGYFIALDEGSGRFYISSLNDGTTWDALDFATAESSPDSLKCVKNVGGNLFLVGDSTFEIWNNTGSSAFPFQRISGAIGDIGILARHSAIVVDNSLVFVGKDRNGSGIVYRTQGFRPTVISTEAIELRIQSSTNLEDIVGYVYQQDGHTFYVITGGGLETSLVYDFRTELWHERAYLNEDGVLEQHLLYDVMFSYGNHIGCDRRNGSIYKLKMDVYSDNGDEIQRLRTFTHIGDENKNIRYNSLEISMETGVGLQEGQGSDPLVSLRLSKDGARTWTDWLERPFGKVGETKSIVKFRRLGAARQLTFELKVTDPVKVAITGAYLQ